MIAGIPTSIISIFLALRGRNLYQPFPSVGSSGITSILELPPTTEDDGTCEVVAGTKRGTVERCLVEEDGSILEKMLLTKVDSSGAVPPPSLALPIYSMARDGTATYLFCGGGDRYVSVWRKKNGTMKNEWQYSQRLGPHTGWVKDVLWDAESERLHSIGCNCIETWEQRDEKWIHWKKSSIESSPDKGSTLSGDLLCLCPFERGLFFAGGVDGRIHLWDSASMGNPLQSIASHSGRVNALSYDPQGKLLFSGSHDGTIKCWSTKGSLLSDRPVTAFVVRDDAHVTSLAHLSNKHDDSGTKLVFGTNKGQIGLISLRVSSGETKVSLLDEMYLLEQPTVNALRTLASANERYRILVGHSRGMACILSKKL